MNPALMWVYGKYCATNRTHYLIGDYTLARTYYRDKKGILVSRTAYAKHKYVRADMTHYMGQKTL